MENQNQKTQENNIDDQDKIEVDDLSVEEFEEEDIDYEDDYLIDNDEFENLNNNTNTETVKGMDDIDMEIVVESQYPTVKGEFEEIKTDGEIYSIAMNDKGVIVLGDGEDTTYFIDADKKTIFKKEKMNKDSVSCIDFSNDGKFLVTGSLDGNAHIFETENYTLLTTVNGSFSEINVNYLK